MAKRLNHENAMFKVTGSAAKESEPTHKIINQPRSIKEMVDEIESCDLCQKTGYACYYHKGLRTMIEHALGSPPLN